MTKQWTSDEIRNMLKSNDAWLFRGIQAIFAKQTADEQKVGMTKEDNGVGFNGADAMFLSSLAVRLNRKLPLSPKQIAIARNKMPKYAGQLAKIANGAV